MSKPVLLLRLEGPLQAWGARARWDVRDTEPEPTKSGVVGLLGCALGYGSGDPRLENELDAGLRFGVRVEWPGRLMEDYQTITDFLPTAEGSYKHSGVKTASSLSRLRSDDQATPATIISPRSYLQDASFLVALEERPGYEGVLSKCEAALRQPAWPIYLGRKACIPTRPVLEALIEDYDGIEDALSRHPWSYLGAGARLRALRPSSERLDVWVEADGPEGGAAARQDAVRTNAARQYGFRWARRIPSVPFEAVRPQEATTP